MNKLLNKKVFLSFSLPGVSYTSSNLKKCNTCMFTKFLSMWFSLVMDCTVLHILESWWRGTARQTARQCNTLYNQKTRSARQGSSDDKVNNSSNFFLTVICVTYHICLIKCTLDEIPERSKIIANISTLFSFNLTSIKFREKSKIILKIIIIVVVIIN